MSTTQQESALYQPEEPVPYMPGTQPEQIIQKADTVPVYTPTPSEGFTTTSQQIADLAASKIQNTTDTAMKTYEGFSPETKKMLWSFGIGVFFGWRWFR